MQSQDQLQSSTYFMCRYPHGLFFLDCLQSEEFRTAMARTEVKVRRTCACASDSIKWTSFVAQEMVHSQQLFFWQHHRNNSIVKSEEAQGDTEMSNADI